MFLIIFRNYLIFSGPKYFRQTHFENHQNFCWSGSNISSDMTWSKYFKYLLLLLSKMIGNTTLFCRCGNIAAILELDENLQHDFTIFEAAPQENRGIPSKKPQADYFLWVPIDSMILYVFYFGRRIYSDDIPVAYIGIQCI